MSGNPREKELGAGEGVAGWTELGQVFELPHFSHPGLEGAAQKQKSFHSH